MSNNKKYKQAIEWDGVHYRKGGKDTYVHFSKAIPNPEDGILCTDSGYTIFSKVYPGSWCEKRVAQVGEQIDKMKASINDLLGWDIKVTVDGEKCSLFTHDYCVKSGRIKVEHKLPDRPSEEYYDVLKDLCHSKVLVYGLNHDVEGGFPDFQKSYNKECQNSIWQDLGFGKHYKPSHCYAEHGYEQVIDPGYIYNGGRVCHHYKLDCSSGTLFSAETDGTCVGETPLTWHEVIGEL
ncbi:MAG: hypothetical protein K0T99_00640 [Alphaproteobacteria bacterium]|nr:hypothetical protein [Alphaproteobacteria bacterium]